MKLAHLILAHNNPSQLKRLVARLNHVGSDVYIHLDKKADINQFAGINEIGNVRFISERIPVFWGEYSIIQATLNSMQEILDSGTDYSHINLLSGNDYPLKSSEVIQDFLFAHKDKSFMWYDKIFDDWVHGQVRMNNYDFGDYGFPGRYQLTKIANKLLPKRKLPMNMVAYGRAQWLTLTPQAVAYVIKYIKDNKKVKDFFRMTWCIDEVFFQTVLCNSPLRDTIVNDNLRHVVLTPDFRPVVFTMQHADELLSSKQFYARKFDLSIDSGIFDFLDEKSVIK